MIYHVSRKLKKSLTKGNKNVGNLSHGMWNVILIHDWAYEFVKEKRWRDQRGQAIYRRPGVDIGLLRHRRRRRR
jgi:hypothetical protein